MSHLRRVFLGSDTPLVEHQFYQLSEAQLHYLTTVLRLGDNAQIIIASSQQSALAHLVLNTTEQGAIVKELLNEPAYFSPVSSLVFALCKGGHSELIIEKATELGVRHIIAYQAERSVMRIKAASDAERKLARFCKVAEAAASQSRQTAVPSINIALSTSNLLATLMPLVEPTDLALLCSLDKKAIPINLVCRPNCAAHLLIGPEGDFSPKELVAFEEVGFQHISLGHNVLRAETAAIAAVAMVNALCARL
jgi:16S rRNA (uracil1498-N3)-methyltransferase